MPDFEPLFPLVTGTAKEGVERVVRVLGGELPEELVNKIVDNIPDIVDNMPEGMSEEMVDMGIQMMLETMRDPARCSRGHGGCLVRCTVRQKL